MLQMMEVYSEWILILPKHKMEYNKEVYHAVDIQFYLLSLKVLFCKLWTHTRIIAVIGLM